MKEWFPDKKAKNKNAHFRFKTNFSLIQGQGSIFMLRECAQSIFRLEISLKSWFLEENQKKNFRVETQFYPDFQGQT